MPIGSTALSSEPSASVPTAELRRVLRLRDLVMLVIGTVIGSGIFLVPGAVLRPLGGSVSLALLVWISGGVLSLLGALTYGELTALRPAAGGLYIFIRDCFGPFLAFLYGWTLFFVISSGSVATLAVAFSNYFSEFLPLPRLMAKLVSVAMILAIAMVNVRGARESADLQNVTTAIKVLMIVAMGSALLWFGKNPVFCGNSAHSVAHPSSLLSGFGLAMISVLWAYEGWQYATFSAGESINPQRDFPLAFLLGSASLIAIYLLANLGYLAALGAMGVAGSSRVAVTAVAALGSPYLRRIVGLAILVSIFSAANSIILTAPRVYYAMAKDGIFFQRLAQVHTRFGTPAFAVVTAAVWSAVLAVSGTFEQLLTCVVFVGWIFYALAAASIFVYRKHVTETTRSYRTPGYPLTPILFISSALVLVLNTMVSQPLRCALGLGIVSLGVPAYLFWRSKRRSSISAQ